MFAYAIGFTYVPAVLVIHALAPAASVAMGVGPMDDPADMIDRLRREVVARHGAVAGDACGWCGRRTGSARWGRHVDRQLGPVTAMAIDRGVYLAYAPSGSGEVVVSSLTSPASSASTSATCRAGATRIGATSRGGGPALRAAIPWDAASSA